MADSRAALRREQVRLLLVAVPVLVTTYLLLDGLGAVSDSKLIALVALLPLAAVLIALGLPLVRERRLVLGGGFLWFFVVYCVFFSLAASARVLEGKRTVVTGFAGDTPSNVLGLNRLGDWHYAVAPTPPHPNDLLVIMLPSFAGQPVEVARQAEIGLIRMAIAQHARGIAFDYDMSDYVDHRSCGLPLGAAGRECVSRGGAGIRAGAEVRHPGQTSARADALSVRPERPTRHARRGEGVRWVCAHGADVARGKR